MCKHSYTTELSSSLTAFAASVLDRTIVKACGLLRLGPILYLGILGLYWGYMGLMEKKMKTTGIIGLYCIFTPSSKLLSEGRSCSQDRRSLEQVKTD